MNIATNCGVLTPFTFEQIKFKDMPKVTHSHIPYFHRMLCNCATSVARNYLWVVVFSAHNKSYLLNKIKSVLPDYEPEGWDTTSAVDSTWTEATQDVIGCVFAQAVNIPGETLNVDKVGISTGSNRGFINAPIINGRQNLTPLDISFLETNQSFADGVIRPWNIVVGHEGLIARPKQESIKSDIYVYQLAHVGEKTPNIIRKAWIYRDCAPISVSTESLVYDNISASKRQTQFVYNSYSLVTTDKCGVFESSESGTSPIANQVPVANQPTIGSPTNNISTTPNSTFLQGNGNLV